MEPKCRECDYLDFYKYGGGRVSFCAYDIESTEKITPSFRKDAPKDCPLRVKNDD